MLQVCLQLAASPALFVGASGPPGLVDLLNIHAGVVICMRVLSESGGFCMPRDIA